MATQPDRGVMRAATVTMAAAPRGALTTSLLAALLLLAAAAAAIVTVAARADAAIRLRSHNLVVRVECWMTMKK